MLHGEELENLWNYPLGATHNVVILYLLFPNHSSYHNKKIIRRIRRENKYSGSIVISLSLHNKGCKAFCSVINLVLLLFEHINYLEL